MGHASRSSVPTSPPIGGDGAACAASSVTSGGHPCVLPSSSARRSRSLHWPSAPAAPRAATPRPAAAPAAAQQPATCKIGMFGALTGADANLGIYIQNGVNLALDEYNKKHADCKVTLENFDSQGDPTQARPWPRRPSTTRRSSASSARPSPVSPRPPTRRSTRPASSTITPSATNPTLADNGWKTFFRALGNDATQGPAAAKYIKDTSRPRRSFVIDDASEYGKGLADIVRKDLGAQVVGNDTHPAEADRLLRLRHQGQGLGRRRALLRWLLRRGRAARSSSCATPAGRAPSSSATASRTRLHRQRRGAPPRARSSPARACPPDVAPEFQAAYKAEYNADPDTYSAEGYDSATSCSTASPRARTARGHARLREVATTSRASPSR